MVWGARIGWVVASCWAASVGCGLLLSACEECVCVEDEDRPWGDAPRECRFVDGEAICVLADGESCPGGGNAAGASAVCEGNTLIECFGPYIEARTDCTAASTCTELDGGSAFCHPQPLEPECVPGTSLCGENYMWAVCSKYGEWTGNGCLEEDDNCRVLRPGQGCFLDASVIDADAGTADGGDGG